MSAEFPVEITVRDIPSTPLIKNRIHKKIEKITTFDPRITYCRVTVGQINRSLHTERSAQYSVTVEVHVPHKTLVANHNHHKNIYTAINDAFHAIKRQLEDHIRIQRHKVKHHSQPLIGTVDRLYENYGFIVTQEGEEYYFDSTHLINDHFNELAAGMEVEFHEDPLAGDSLQARHIRFKKYN